MIELGAKPSAKLIKKQELNPTEDVAQGLLQEVNESVVFIERIRLANDEPISVDCSWLPLEIGRKVINYDLERFPLYSLFEEKFSIEIGDATYKIQSSIAKKELQEPLKINEGDPLFIIIGSPLLI